MFQYKSAINSLILLLVFFSVAFCIFPRQSFAAGYSYVRPIVINAATYNPATQPNFTVLICANGTLGNGNSCQTVPGLNQSGAGAHVQNASGNDIVFSTVSDCSSGLMSWEKEKYVASTGEFEAWVLIPSLGTTNQTIYMCYGNSGISTFQGGAKASVWSANYADVWHFANNPGLDATDSVGSHDGTVFGLTTTAGQIAGSALNTTISGSNRIDLGDVAQLNNVSNFTISSWVYFQNFDQFDGLNTVFSKGQDQAYSNDLLFYADSSGGLNIQVDNAADGGASGPTLSAGQFYHLVLTYDGTQTGNANRLKLYVNGAAQTLSFAAYTVPATTANMSGSPYEFGNYFSPRNIAPIDGAIDESRLSTNTFSPNWITTEYNNQSSPSSFETFNSESPIITSSLSVSPNTIPSNNSNNITLTLTGTGTSWVQGVTTFTVSGVANATATSQNVTSSTSATVVIHTGAGTGTLTVSDGTNSNTATVASGCFSNGTHSSWNYCKVITIDHTKVSNLGSGSETYTNFPVLFSEATDSSLVAHALSSGNDILFVASDDSTKLNHEIEKYNSGTGEIEAWVQVPSLSPSSDVLIKMYYGNAGASNQQNVTGTWDTNFKGVYHLPNGSSLTTNDSTISARSGTKVGPPTATTGKIDGAGAFSGSSQYVDLPTSGLPTGSTSKTLECWANTQTTSGSFLEIAAFGNNGTLDQDFSFGANNSDLFGGGAGGASNMTVPGFWATNVWHDIALTYDGTTMRLYGDGSQLSTLNRTLNTVIQSARIGSQSFSTPGSYWNGYIDECRISNSVRSADWLKTEYTNENTPASFYSTGSELVGNSLSFTPSTVPSNHSGNITLTLTGVGTSWVQGVTTFTVSGVANVTKVSQNVTSSTAATVVVTTGAGTGTLTVSDGTNSNTAIVATPSFLISPTTGTTSTTPTLTITGTNTVWSQETAAGLFSVSGGTGSSIGTPTITTNTAGTVVLTTGSATGTLTITDNSTGATTTFTVATPDFTITTPTSAIGAGTPSRAITLTITNGSVGGSTASFALTDGGAGGTFYPSSPVTIAANSSVGTTTQFVYIPASNATGTITLQAIATGGIAATHTINLPIGTATKFVSDTFTGSAGTNLTSHTPNIGATWVNPNTVCGAMSLLLNGTGGVYDSGAGHTCGSWVLPTNSPSNEHDITATVSNISNTDNISDISTFVGNNSSLNGYRFGLAGGSYFFSKFVNNGGTSFFTGIGSVSNGSSHTMKIAVRTINGLQYLFPISDSTIINGPVQDSTFTSGAPGFLREIPTGKTPASTTSVMSNFIGSNVDWAAPPLSVFPSSIPSNHSGDITLTLTGTGTSWVQGVTTFTVSGVANVTKVSQNVTSSTAATVVIHTGAGTGTLTVSDGTNSNTVAVATPSISISPTTGGISTTPTLTLTGTNTIWGQETATGLFSVSGGTGSSIGTPTITANTAGTVVLTVGSAAGTLTITDNSTGATTTFTATVPGDFTITTPTSAIGAGTPSRAITLTVTGGSVGGSTASFALTDGGAGGTFYPASPVTIAANSTVGSTTQFVYIPASNATGTITLQAVATGGITATHTLALPIGTATKYVYDTFTGSTGSNITSHTPNIGATWVNPNTVCGSAMSILLNGSGGAYNSGTGHTCGSWVVPTNPSSSEHDIAETISNINNTSNSSDVTAFIGNNSTLNGYRLSLSGGTYGFDKYVSNIGTSFFSSVGSISNGSTHTIKIAVRTINGLQYLFPMADGALISGVTQDSTFTSGPSGQIAEIPSGQTPLSTASVISNFIGTNADWAPNTPATAYTLGGPTSSTISQQSSNFTVIPNGLYTGTITPSDSGAGGTFTPSSLTFSGSLDAQTFTYTAASTGSKTISVTSSPGLTNPPSISLTVTAGPLVVTFPNSNVYQSPYTWRASGSTIIAPTSGAYLKFQVTGTTQVIANVDTTINSGFSANDMPTIKVYVDSSFPNGTSSFVQFPANNTASTPVTLATGLDPNTTHTVSLYMIGGNRNSGNGWTGTAYHTKINSLQFDGNATLSSQTLSTKTCLFLGDSILQAYFGDNPSGPYYTWVDYTKSWPSYVAPSLNCEFGVVGIGGQGWVNNSAGGGYPQFPQTWNYFDSTHQKSFTTPPDYVLINMGSNDHGYDVSSAVPSTLAAMRTAFGGTTKIYVTTPYNPTFAGLNPSGSLVTGFNTYQTNSGGDAKTYLVDLGTTVQAYALSPNSLDNIHPNRAAHASIGAIILSDLPAIFDPPTATSVNITGTTTVGQTLTGHYSFSDPNSLSDISTYQWSRATISGGSYSNISGATNATYVLTSADIGQYIKFTVTPTSSAGAGTAVPSSPTAQISSSAGPTASSLSITGTQTEGQTLTGHYTYTQADSVAEGVSTFRWLESTTSGGSYSAISSATSNTYALAPSDVGKFIKFEVTPVAVYPVTLGTAVPSSPTGAIAASSLPVASAVSVTGTLTQGQTLTGHYTYSDTGSHSEATSTFRWLSSTTSGGSYSAIGGATSSTYILTSSETGKYVRFEVTPVSTVTSGSPVQSNPTTQIQNTGVPTASSVNITGTQNVGQTLTGTYIYADPGSFAEGASTYRWLESDTSGGTYTAINGATSNTYTLLSSDLGKYLEFEVTPISTVPPTTGSTGTSTFSGPVITYVAPVVISQPISGGGHPPVPVQVVSNIPTTTSLPATPITTPVTSSLLPITTHVTAISPKSEIKNLQSFLNTYVPNTHLVVDGKFGKLTTAAIKAFQKLHGLTADGVVGPKTRAVMNTIHG